MTPARAAVLSDVASRIAAVRCPHPTRVAIDGVDAAGKTTMADELAPMIAALGRPVVRASIDGFHHPRAVRRRRGSLSPDGYYHDSFNHPALIEHVLQPLGPGGSGLFRRAVFDYHIDEPIESDVERAEAAAVLLFDGVFLLRPELRGYFDYSVFVHADFDEALRRAERRDFALFGDVHEVRLRYRDRYIPGQQLYLNAVRPRELASVVIDNNDPAHPRTVGP